LFLALLLLEVFLLFIFSRERSAPKFSEKVLLLCHLRGARGLLRWSLLGVIEELTGVLRLLDCALLFSSEASIRFFSHPCMRDSFR